MKFAHRYKLLKPMPGHAAGSEIVWHGSKQFFYFYRDRRTEFSLQKIDFEGTKFTVEQVQNKKWFKPIGELKDFIPPFPAKEKLGEYVDLTPDCRLVDGVDECRAINSMLADADFQGRLYEFYKEQYGSFHGLK